MRFIVVHINLLSGASERASELFLSETNCPFFSLAFLAMDDASTQPEKKDAMEKETVTQFGCCENDGRVMEALWQTQKIV